MKQHVVALVAAPAPLPTLFLDNSMLSCTRHPRSRVRLAGLLTWSCLLASIASDLKLIAQGPLISGDGINGLNQAQSAAYEMNLEEAEKMNS